MSINKYEVEVINVFHVFLEMNTYEEFMFWVLLVLAVQSILCFKIKSRIVRLLPIIFCIVYIIAFIIMIAITPPSWERGGYLILIMYTVYTMVTCGIAWWIWAITKYKRKKRT